MDKLYQNNLDQNSNGRKKTHGLTYTVTTTPKRLKDGFTNKLDTKKKSTPVPSAPHTTRSSTAAVNAVTLVSSTKTFYDPSPVLRIRYTTWEHKKTMQYIANTWKGQGDWTEDMMSCFASSGMEKGNTLHRAM